MAQPKKLTHKQRMENKIKKDMEQYIEELSKIHRGMKKKPTEMDTWKWAALEVYKQLSSHAENKHPEVQKCINTALHLAREAQLARNFAS